MSDLDNIADEKELIFIWWKDDEYGVFLTRAHYDFLESFYGALCSKYWGVFWGLLGRSGQDYVAVFMQCDDIAPKDTDLLSDIESEVFILSDGEFPITQCAEETYKIFQCVLPEQYCEHKVRTEYGENIGLFPKSRFVEMKDIIEDEGYQVGVEVSPFPKSIHYYPA